MTSFAPFRPRLTRLLRVNALRSRPEGWSRPPTGRCAGRRSRAVPFGVAGHGDYRGDGDDPAALALAEIGGVEPKIGPLARERPVEAGADPFVDVLAELRDGGLRDAWTGPSPAPARRPAGSRRRRSTPLGLNVYVQPPPGPSPLVFLGSRKGREVAALARAWGSAVAATPAGCPASGRGSRCGRSAARRCARAVWRR